MFWIEQLHEKQFSPISVTDDGIERDVKEYIYAKHESHIEDTDVETERLLIDLSTGFVLIILTLSGSVKEYILLSVLIKQMPFAVV